MDERMRIIIYGMVIGSIIGAGLGYFLPHTKVPIKHTFVVNVEGIDKIYYSSDNETHRGI